AYEDEQKVYQEIHYFQIKMKDVKSAKRIYRMIAEAMPYPLLIRFVTSKGILWIGAIHERVEKTGLLKMQDVFSSNPEIDEKLYLTNWAFSRADTYNLKAFYENLLNQMVQIELKERYEAVTDQELTDNIVKLDKIIALEKEIDFYISKAKKETQMNKRIEWQMKANTLKEKKEKKIKREKNEEQKNTNKLTRQENIIQKKKKNKNILSGKIMDKKRIPSSSPDSTQVNIEKMKELFPEIVTEGKVDFDMLKTVLGEIIDDRSERYKFEWH